MSLVLALLALTLATALISWFFGRMGQPGWPSLLGALGGLGLAVLVAGRVMEHGPIQAADGLLYVDALGALMLVLVGVMGALASLYSLEYMRVELNQGNITAKQHASYFLWFHLFLLTMQMVVITDNMALMWAAIESTTLVSALLVGFFGGKLALEAAWKYVILCSVGILFAFLGLILLAYALRSPEHASVLSWLSWKNLGATGVDPGLVRLGFIFLLVGYGTKVGLAPFHWWKPDAYSQAPAPVSALLSGVLVNSAFYGIMRVRPVVDHMVGAGYATHLLLGLGIASIAIAVPFMLLQRDLGRLLAYSSVEHMGLIALGLGFGGPVGIFGSLLHMVNHAVTKGLLFFSVGNLRLAYGTTFISGIRGAARWVPYTAVGLLVGALAITGTPPFGVFASEFRVLSAGVLSGHWLVVALTVLLLVGVFAGMMLHATRMALSQWPSGSPRAVPGWCSKLSLLLCLGLVVLLGLYIPAPLENLLRQAAAVLGG